MRTFRPQKEAVFGLLLVALTSLIGCKDEKQAGTHLSTTATPSSNKDSPPSIKIAAGTLDQSIRYYDFIKFRFGLKLIIPDIHGNPVLNPNHKLDDVLSFAGYEGVAAANLDKLTATEINDPATFQNVSPGHPIQKGDLTAVSFFAPKITDVSIPIANVPDPSKRRKVGFRKCIRAKAREGSTAQGKGVSEIWILFNYFVPSVNLTTNPQLEQSGNTQVILITNTPGPGNDPAYFLVYGPTSNCAALTNFLEATFDARHPVTATDVGAPGATTVVRKYYVPTACAVCHGGPKSDTDVITFPTAKLNYFDTDHWNLRINADATDPGIDFSDVKAAGVKPLLDSKFADFIELNASIRKQNDTADDLTDGVVDQNGAPSFQALAVEAWINAHSGGNEAASPFDRSVSRIPSGGGAPVKWDATNATDRQLLPLLDRYCYRCHSSVVFNVYDKLEVRQRVFSNEIEKRLKAPFKTPTLAQPDPNQPRMPQDRELDTAVKDRLLELIDQLAQSP